MGDKKQVSSQPENISTASTQPPELTALLSRHMMTSNAGDAINISAGRHSTPASQMKPAVSPPPPPTAQTSPQPSNASASANQQPNNSTK